MKRWSNQPAMLAATAIAASCLAYDGGVEAAPAKLGRIAKSATVPGATQWEVHDNTRGASGSPTADGPSSNAVDPPRKRQRAAKKVQKANGEIRRVAHRKGKHQHTFLKKLRRDAPLFGLASFYSEDVMTASGERFNKHAMHAAHPSLPFGTRLRVTNVLNGKSVVVRVNDRGPFVRGRIIDLTLAAAEAIGMIKRGIVNVTLDIVR
ncbi:septal ring lytic transglycosylase RlpA family protein [Bradyrhizobium liaoningense]|uniref:septal ring lytic transglycosylase RlpA family protein n=1 Tax=Bradyrhizobium liaoningense TaxID=43992 RepID=UPI001FE9558D|nr:septal ring lytic transglycosylase RlpA family protein [Bradyrhizobium liaoningense]